MQALSRFFFDDVGARPTFGFRALKKSARHAITDAIGKTARGFPNMSW
jgi:hypothetical protein